MKLEMNKFTKMLNKYRIKNDNLTLITKGCVIYSKCIHANKDKDLERLLPEVASFPTVTDEDKILKDKLKDAIWRRLGC